MCSAALRTPAWAAFWGFELGCGLGAFGRLGASGSGFARAERSWRGAGAGEPVFFDGAAERRQRGVLGVGEVIHRTGRTMQFNARAKPETVEALYAIADR
jgi:hypothetical protein